MRLVQISDIHLFADPATTLLGLNTAKSFAAVLELLQRDPQPPDMIILSGDLSQDFTPQSYLNVADAMQSFTCPIYWYAGNHDAPDVMQRTLSQTSLKSDKAVLHGNWQLILLNSHYPKHVSGLLGRAELARLDYFLQQHPKQHTLVFLHHHPLRVSSTWLDKSCLVNPEDFFAITDRHTQIRGIIYGHVHQVFEAYRQGIPLLSAPSTCIQFSPGSHDFALDNLNPGYRWFDLASDGTFKTGIERLKDFDNTTDFSSKGY